MSDTPSTAPQPPNRNRWTFLRKFRWTVYSLFLALLVFVAVCTIVGVVTNLRERHLDLDVSTRRPGTQNELSSLHLRDCLTALENLHTEQVQKVQEAFTGERDREAFLSDFRAWDRQWRQKFEKLGFSCRLTDGYAWHAALLVIAEAYRLVDEAHRYYSMEIRRFMLENGVELYKLHKLFEDAQRAIERLEAQPSEE